MSLTRGSPRLSFDATESRAAPPRPFLRRALRMGLVVLFRSRMTLRSLCNLLWRLMLLHLLLLRGMLLLNLLRLLSMVLFHLLVLCVVVVLFGGLLVLLFLLLLEFLVILCLLRG